MTYKDFEFWTKEKLWELREEICLNSLYIWDYENSFGIDPYNVSNFFDGFLDYVDELMKENKQNIHTDYFFHLLPLYDTKEIIWNWFNCFDVCPFAD